MFSRINSVGLVGLNAFPVFVEIESSKGLPSFDIVGQGDMVVRESRERIKSAFRTSEFKFPLASLMINLAPADIKKMGSTYDFAIAVALLQINQMISENAIDKTAFVGELSLNGEVRAVKGVLPMVIKAKEQGIKRIYVPFSNGREGSVVSGIEVVGVKTLREFVQFANGEESPRTMGMYTPEATDYFGDLDFADVKGQESTKRALEISACG
ncbi:MAG: ATP-binding protein, partial [Clostridiales bacterium]|nr:ATP-binding protein [Clostridiales bacterium]